jgi:NodT family efflux transporter outer membrane factor (OMF) lipoprotein
MIGQLYEVQLAETQWEIDFWGRVRSLKAAALQRYLASDAARQATTLSVVTGVANAYLTLCEIDERIVLTRATIDTRRESLRIFRLRYAAGAISRLDLTQSEILLQQAESLGVQLQQARATAADALALLVGAPRAGRSAARARRRRGAAVARAGLPSSLLERRPDVIAAEHELQASRANIGAARAAFFPRIALTSAIGSGSSALHDLLTSGTGVWSLIPSATLPLIDGGRNRSNLALANAQRDEALARYEKTLRRVPRRLRRARRAPLARRPGRDRTRDAGVAGRARAPREAALRQRRDALPRSARRAARPDERRAAARRHAARAAVEPRRAVRRAGRRPRRSARAADGAAAYPFD